MHPLAPNANKRCWFMQSSSGKLPVRCARGPCGAGVGMLLARMFSTTSFSCIVRCKDEADRECYV